MKTILIKIKPFFDWGSVFLDSQGSGGTDPQQHQHYYYPVSYLQQNLKRFMK